MSPTQRRPGASWAFLLAALFALKFALLLIDGRPTVFMGDSASYLYTALHGYIPADRSFVYGFLLRPLAVWPHSLHFLVFAQGAMSAGSAWLIAFVLVRFFRVPFRWAAALSFLCAVEPLQLISERYVMTDTMAVFLFALLVAVSLDFLERPNYARLLGAMAIGVALISIRLSYLPVVFLDSAILPLWWFRRFTGPRDFRAWALLTLWLGTGQVMLYGYRRANAAVSHVPAPEYLYAGGMMLLAQVSPIVAATDFPGSLPGAQILGDPVARLGDPLYRGKQLFLPDGLCARLRRFFPDDYRANQAANRIAMHAILTKPLPFAATTAETWSGYFDARLLVSFLRLEEGGLIEPGAAFREEILKTLGTDPGLRSFDGPVWRWHRAAIPWYWLLVTFPLVTPVFLVWGWRRLNAASILVLGYLFVLFVWTMAMAPNVEPRYLMPIAWLCFLIPGCVFQLASRRS